MGNFEGAREVPEKISIFFHFSNFFDFLKSVQKGPEWSQKCLKYTKIGFGLFVGCPRGLLGVKEGRPVA